MSTNTYVALDKITVAGTSTTSITLSPISGTYKDLRLVISSQNQNSTNQLYIQFNADVSNGSSNYSTTSMRGEGSSVGSNRHVSNNGWYPVPGPGVGTTGNFQPWIVDIMDYSNTTTFKSGISRFNNPVSIVAANGHLWRSTAAITSITIKAESGAGYIAPGSTFSLYGIRAWAAETTPKASGGYVYSDTTYWYHAFPFSSTFTPTQSLTADVLVVAGGGGGGNGNGGGGGGAGGVLGLTSQSLTTTPYTITIGAGGAMSADGASSSFASSVALKGGRGGDAGANGTGGSGTYGSGGGLGRDGGQFGGAGTSGQGFRGGNSAYPSTNGGSGGGGAGAVGQDAFAENGASPWGNGGIGVNTYASWLSPGQFGVDGYIAGGGGGSAYNNSRSPEGGLGGGGRGTMRDFALVGATPGVVSTGSGGGGGGTGAFKSNGMPGGSGLVVIRYAK